MGGIMKVKVTQLCPILCDPIDCSPSGSCVDGILQARILEWVAISFSRGKWSTLDQLSFIQFMPISKWLLNVLATIQSYGSHC